MHVHAIDMIVSRQLFLPFTGSIDRERVMSTSREKSNVQCYVDKPRDKGQETGIAQSNPDPGATDGRGFDRRLTR